MHTSPSILEMGNFSKERLLLVLKKVVRESLLIKTSSTNFWFSWITSLSNFVLGNLFMRLFILILSVSNAYIIFFKHEIIKLPLNHFFNAGKTFTRIPAPCQLAMDTTDHSFVRRKFSTREEKEIRFLISFFDPLTIPAVRCFETDFYLYK